MVEIGRKAMRGSDGNNYVVIISEERLDVSSFSGSGSIGGARYLHLEDGREVIRLDNRDTIQGTDIHLTEID